LLHIKTPALIMLFFVSLRDGHQIYIFFLFIL